MGSLRRSLSVMISRSLMVLPAGSAEFKMQLTQSEYFDPRLSAIHLCTVDVSYGGENGFNQAIELASGVLSNVKFVLEKKLIGQFFDEIAQDTGKMCFGIQDTMRALDMGAIETLIMFEDLGVSRVVIRDAATQVEEAHFLTPE